jgi:hypothetical protein
MNAPLCARVNPPKPVKIVFIENVRCMPSMSHWMWFNMMVHNKRHPKWLGLSEWVQVAYVVHSVHVFCFHPGATVPCFDPRQNPLNRDTTDAAEASVFRKAGDLREGLRLGPSLAMIPRDIFWGLKPPVILYGLGVPLIRVLWRSM